MGGDTLLRRIQYVPPGAGSDEEYLVQNFLFHELGQLDRQIRWRNLVAGVPFGRAVEAPLPVLLQAVRVGLAVQRRLGGRTVYSGHPVAGRSTAVEWLLFEQGQSPPTDAPVEIRRVRPTVVARSSDLLAVDRGFLVEDWKEVGFREFMPELPTRAFASDRLRGVLDGVRAARTVIESSFRAFAGAPPVSGLGAGLDAVLAAPDIDGLTALGALRSLAPLRPFWEHAGIRPRGPRLWAGDPRRFPAYAPHSILVDSFTSPRAVSGHPVGSDRSSLLASPSTTPVLLSLLSGSDDPIIRPGPEIEVLAGRQLPPETVGPASSILLMAHAIVPVPESDAEIERALEAATAEMADDTRTFLTSIGSAHVSLADLLRRSPRFRDAILRSALARARTEYRSRLETSDVRSVARAFADSVAATTRGAKERDLRQYRVGTDLITSDRETRRVEMVDSKLVAGPGSTLAELWEAVRHLDLWGSMEDLERWVDRHIQEGRYFQSQGRISKT